MSTDENNDLDLNEEQITLINQLVFFQRIGHSLGRPPDFTASLMTDDCFVIEGRSKDNRQKYSISEVNSADFNALNNKGYISLYQSQNNPGKYKLTLDQKACKLVPVIVPTKPSILVRLENLPNLLKVLGILIPSIFGLVIAYFQFVRPLEISNQFTQTAEFRQMTLTAQAVTLTPTLTISPPLTITSVPTETSVNISNLAPVIVTDTLTNTPTRTPTPTPTSTITKSPTFSRTPTNTLTSIPLTLTLSPTHSLSGFTPYPTSSDIIKPETKTRLKLLSFWKTANPVFYLDVSPTDNFVASAEQNGNVIVRNATNGVILQSLKYGNSVKTVSFSVDGKWLAAAGNDGVVKVWNTTNWINPILLSGHSGAITSLAFSPDGRWLASGGDDKSIRLWAVDANWNPRDVILNSQSIRVVVFSTDSQYIAVGSNDTIIRIWSLNGDKSFKLEHINGPKKGSIISLAFSREGDLLFSGSTDVSNPFQVWDFMPNTHQGGNLEKRLPADGEIFTGNVIAFSPDGTIFVTGTSNKSFTLWRTSTLSKILPVMDAHQDEVTSIDFSSDGKLMITGSKDKTIRIWGIK